VLNVGPSEGVWVSIDIVYRHEFFEDPEGGSNIGMRT